MIGNKVLSICAWGNSRSVALGWLLKEKYGRQVLACGMSNIDLPTLVMLCEWADTIILTTQEASHPKLADYKDKLLIWDVGRDVYWRGYAPELIEMYEKFYADEVNK